MRGVLIYATNFFLTTALGVVFVFLEDVQTDLGLADWEIGVIAGTGFFAALVVQLGLSPLADRGRRVPLLVVALTAGVAGPIGFAFGESVGALAFSRGLTGIGLGMFGLLARKALIGLDIAGGGAKLGILLSTAVAGFIAGPLIGALLEPISFEAPFIAVSAAILVTGVASAGVILRADIAASPVDYSELRRLVVRPRVQAAMLVQVIIMSYIGVFDAVVDRFLTDLGASTGGVALVIVFVGAPMLVLPRLAGNLAEARGASAVMLPALLVLVPVMFGYWLVGGLVAATLAGLAHGSGESFAAVSAQVLVLEVTGAERAAVGSALLETAGLTAAGVSALVAPLAYGAGGQALFLSTALVGVVLALTAFQRVRNAWD